MDGKEHPTDDGVSYLLGKMIVTPNLDIKDLNAYKNDKLREKDIAVSGDHEQTEKVVTILFDRTKFSEDRAQEWWENNKYNAIFSMPSVST